MFCLLYNMLMFFPIYLYENLSELKVRRMLFWDSVYNSMVERLRQIDREAEALLEEKEEAEEEEEEEEEGEEMRVQTAYW